MLVGVFLLFLIIGHLYKLGNSKNFKTFTRFFCSTAIVIFILIGLVTIYYCIKSVRPPQFFNILSIIASFPSKFGYGGLRDPFERFDYDLGYAYYEMFVRIIVNISVFAMILREQLKTKSEDD